MVTAAFKSNSKRSNEYVRPDYSPKTNPPNPNPNPNPPPQKQRLRRSLSVNALSRSTQIDVSSEFLNKRDNPLYWAAGGSPADNTSPIDGGGGAIELGTSKSSNVTVGERGRSVRRNSDVRNGGLKEEIGGRRRSLSRVNNNGGGNGRRGRSVSRANLGYGASESEVEQESRIAITNGGRSGSIQASSSTKKLPVSGVKASSNKRSSYPSRHPSVASSFDSQVSNWEDGISTSSLSEAEEKTIKAVYEQMKSFEGEKLRKESASSEIYETVRYEVRRAIADIQDDLQDAIWRNSNGAHVSTDVTTDISTKLVKPGAVDLVLDVRREYAKELEESGERARKLRSDLAIEEHRRQELSRILKETLPEPKTSVSHRSRLGRKSSSERKKMSKRLTDEAMSYFDDVSLSTFDSSDFSAAEVPSVNSAAISPPTGACAMATTSLPRPSSGPSRCIDQQMIHDEPGSSSVVDSSWNEVVMDRVVETTNTTERDRNFSFSFGHKPVERIELQHDIKNYITAFEKDTSINGVASERSRSNYNVDAYDLLDVNETLLFDKVFFKSRQEAGSLHICGGVVVPFLPFSHLF